MARRNSCPPPDIRSIQKSNTFLFLKTLGAQEVFGVVWKEHTKLVQIGYG